MTLLSMVRSSAVRIGIGRPNVIATATDATGLQLLEFAQQEGDELARYGDWRVLRKEKTFTTVAAETQTDTPIPTDWAGFLDETIWNRTRKEPLYGPVEPDQWQAWKAHSTFPVRDTFTLRGTSWLMQPTPTAGHTIAYEYRSANWCQSSGGTAQSAWAADTDTGILPERLMGLGLIWRYKQARGMLWETDFDKYMYEVDAALAKDKPRKIIDLRNGGPPQRVPGVTIPEGNWNL
jgi:hypothetical protein